VISLLNKVANVQIGTLVGFFVAAIAILSTFLEVSKIKINPWSTLAKAIGKALNGDVLNELAEVKAQQKKTQAELEKHIKMDDECNADLYRARILQFNRELLRDSKPSHTEEDFNEILYNISCYERYCDNHPDYKNNRAVHAIKNIERVYDESMETHGFL